MVNERACRREGVSFRQSVPVVLADGQAWHLPKLWVEARALDSRAEDGRLYEDDLAPVLERVRAAETLVEQVCAVAELGAFLLRRNYAVPAGELGELLRFRPDDLRSIQVSAAILRIATGNGERSFERWRRLALMIAAGAPDVVLLEDANDLASMMSATLRVIPPSKWVDGEDDPDSDLGGVP